MGSNRFWIKGERYKRACEEREKQLLPPSLKKDRAVTTKLAQRIGDTLPNVVLPAFVVFIVCVLFVKHIALRDTDNDYC